MLTVNRWGTDSARNRRPHLVPGSPAVAPSSLAAQYRAAFQALRDALAAHRRAPPGLARADALRTLQEALDGAETLVRTHQLKTRPQAFVVGALRSGGVYLNGTDKERMEEARRILEAS